MIYEYLVKDVIPADAPKKSKQFTALHHLKARREVTLFFSQKGFGTCALQLCCVSLPER